MYYQTQKLIMFSIGHKTQSGITRDNIFSILLTYSRWVPLNFLGQDTYRMSKDQTYELVNVKITYTWAKRKSFSEHASYFQIPDQVIFKIFLT